MKKYILLAVLLSLGTIIFLYHTDGRKQLGDLVKANIEALSFNESDTSERCEGTGSLDCPYSDDKAEYVFEGYGLRHKKR